MASGGAKAKVRRPVISAAAADEDDTSAPLDKQLLSVHKAGVATRVSAIHFGWAENRYYVVFTWPPCTVSRLSCWLDGVDWLVRDLQWLLTRSYHCFWSQVVYDLQLAACLDASLAQLPRPHELPLLPHAESVGPRLALVSQLLLKVCLRMATYKESRQSHMSPGHFAKLVYECYLWDVGRMVDVCAVFAAGNGALLTRLLSTLFTHQPAYWQDLEAFVHSLPALLSRTEARVSAVESAGGDWTQFWDVLRYVADVGWSLRALLSCFTDACRTLLNAGVPIRLASFYGTVMPRLQRRLVDSSSVGDGVADLRPSPADCQRHLRLARCCLVDVFRLVLETCCLPTSPSDANPQSAASRTLQADAYLELMSDCLAERLFLTDYNLQHPVSLDVEHVANVCPEADVERLAIIASAVMADGRPPSPTADAGDDAGSVPVEPPVAGDRPPLESASSHSDVEVQSMVSHVRDLLPTVSEYFVNVCLRHYDYSPEKVINALLEDSLPSELSALDRTAAGPPAPQQPDPSADPVPDPVVSTGQREPPRRRNVFDGDEFDVFSRGDVDASRFVRGKAGRRQRVARELQDRSELREDSALRQKYELFGSLSCEGSVYEAALYEDEYDDTYDGPAGGQQEPDSAPTAPLERVTLNDRLPSTRWRASAVPEEEEDEDEGQSAQTSGGRRHQFVENPAEVRARAEQRRQTQQQRRRGGREGGGAARSAAGRTSSGHQTSNGGVKTADGGASGADRAGGPGRADDNRRASEAVDKNRETERQDAAKHRDVVGKPRGQGQDHDVQRNRRVKGAHKSTQQRRGSDRKQRGGMF